MSGSVDVEATIQKPEDGDAYVRVLEACYERLKELDDLNELPPHVAVVVGSALAAVKAARR